MASILELTLQESISTDSLVAWLQNKSNANVPECLEELVNVKLEFIPFFLNYLRDHTIHLIQSSKSATPSPAKTPSLKKLHKSVKRGRENGGKRQQLLFGASNTAGDVEDLRNLPSSLFSPNTSLESPGIVHVNHKGDGQRNQSKGNLRGSKASQKYSPQCGSQRSPYMQQTPEQRSKQKLSLAEFMYTPDQSNNANNSWKKKSPHSGAKSKDFSVENTPSPVISHGRKSAGKKRHSYSPLVPNKITSDHLQESNIAPVFSLTNSNDFPPMCSSNTRKKVNQNRRSLDSNIDITKADSCDTKTSRAINFSNNNSNDTGAMTKFARERLKDVQRISPVTVQANTGARRITPTSVKVDNSSTGARRITPTLVKVDNSVEQNSAFLVPIDEHEKSVQSEVNRNDNCCGKPGTRDVLQGERELLKEERAKSQSQTSESDVVSIPTPTKASLDHSTSVTEIAEAYLGEVTHQDKLDILLSLYSKCLDGNLFPNVVVELYFLVQLLTARGGDVEDTYVYGDDVIEENYFSTVHNTVYFAISVLEQQKRLLRMLDKCTLHLLLENPRVATFSIDLQHFLEHCYDQAEAKKGPAFPRSPIGSVSFQADTDNRKNFPNDKSFHLFRRQRDGFYELLREWEASRMNSNYNMAEMFGGRVRALVSVKTELANLIHFARLFQSQLIAMCKGDGSIRSHEDDENIALLSHLKRTNPEKFKRLQERFIKPLSIGGPCPTPCFPGIQEFFRDFIVVACNPLLNQHLCDTFTAKVLELNETTFATHDDEDAVTSNGDEEEREMFCSVLLNLRLVGKFLGFVTFLPYQSPDRIPDSMEATYISIRNKHMPAIDLVSCLKTAITEGSVTLTIPWIVDYLSMMDTLAPRLEHYQLLLYIVLYIHRYMWVQLQEEMTFSNLLVVALISWLMETPVITDGFFFSEIPDDVEKLVQGHLPSLAALDNRNFVDQALFYTCCPYIGEVKALLVDFAVGSSSKISNVRKITPVSADVPATKSLTDTQLQLQMEENFFHNHPPSMKRVVDFVADRTASNFIKKFRASMLQQTLTDGKERVMKQLISLPDGSPSSKMKDRVSQVTSKIAQELYTSVRAVVVTDAPRYCEGKVPSLMMLLLPDDQSDVVVKMASSISERIAEEKIVNWMNKHVSTAMYHSEIMPDIDKVARTLSQQEVPSSTGSDKTGTQSVDKTGNQFDVTSHVTSTIHDESLKHPSEVLIDFKDCLKNLVLKGRPLAEKKIQHLLTETRETFKHRQDILPSVHKSFTQLTVELLLALLLHQPGSYSPTIVDTCMQLWKSVLRDTVSLSLMFSGRVIRILQQASDIQMEMVWQEYTHLLLILHKEKLVQPLQLQETGQKFIPYIKDDSTVSRLCHCLCTLADTMSEVDRAEKLGACLELLFNMLPSEDCPEANLILDTLGVNNNNNSSVFKLDTTGES